MKLIKKNILAVIDVSGSGVISGYVYHGRFVKTYAEQYSNDSVADKQIPEDYFTGYILPLMEKALQMAFYGIKEYFIDNRYLDINTHLVPIGVSLSGQISEEGKLYSASSILGAKLKKPIDIKRWLKRRYRTNEIFIMNNVGAASHYLASLDNLSGKKFLVLHAGKGIGSKVYDGATRNLLLDREGFCGEIGHVRVMGVVRGERFEQQCDCTSFNHLAGYILRRGMCTIVKRITNEDVVEKEIYSYLSYKEEVRKEVFDVIADCICQAIVPIILAIGIDVVVIKGSHYYCENKVIQRSLLDALELKIKEYLEPYLTVSKDFFVDYMASEEQDREINLLGLYSYYERLSDNIDGIYTGVIDNRPAIVVSNTRSASFPIIRTDNLSLATGIILHKLQNRPALVVIDKTLDELYKGHVERTVSQMLQGKKYSIVLLSVTDEGGEKKDYRNLERVVREAVNMNMPRHGVIIGIGGGVLLDIVGFAAQQYRRMIQYYRIPTTLVGQIDAGVGIKVGINYEDNKNLLGSFYPPRLVINCSEFLLSLSEEDFCCGISEMIKAGIADCPELINKFVDLNTIYSPSELNKSTIAFEEFKTTMDLAIQTMLNNLHSNFYEERELKRLMDFGHTFSPIIEGNSNYSIPHGFAVAIDMFICIVMANILKLIGEEVFDVYTNIFENYGLLRYFNGDIEWYEKIFSPSIEKTISHRAGNLNLVVPVGYGEAGFLNLEECEICNNEDYVVIVSREKLKTIYMEAIQYMNKICRRSK